VATLEDGVHIYHLLPSPSTSGDKANSGEGPSADIFWTASLRLSTPFEVSPQSAILFGKLIDDGAVFLISSLGRSDHEYK
jgi:hypothetical protein